MKPTGSARPPSIIGAAAIVLAGSMSLSGCHHFGRRLVPLPPAGETALLADIVGVARRPEAGGGVAEYSEVFAVRWTPSALVIDGVLDRNVPGVGRPAAARRDTLSFSYDDVSHLVLDARPGGAEVLSQRLLVVLGGGLGVGALVLFYLPYVLR